MRVAMIDPSLFTPAYDRALATALAEGGHQVTLFSRRPRAEDGSMGDVPLVEAFYRLAGSPMVAGLPQRLRLGVKGLEHVWSMARLIARLRRLAPDVIHFQWLALPLVDLRMLAGLRRIAPLVLTIHDTNPFNGDPSSRLQFRGFAESLAQFDRLVVHTSQGEARLLAQGVPADRLVRVPHGAELAQRHLADDAMQGEISFVLFGKIKPYKGADLLIEAFARLPERLRDQARLRIIGKPYMDLAPLHAAIGAHGLGERCTIEARYVAEAEIPAVFGPGRVAVFPYREIDSSGVLFQALACGRPVVASRIGSFAELLEGREAGLLTERDDIAGLAAAMARLIEDRGFAAQCGRGARALCAEAAGWDDVARRTAAVYLAASRANAAASDGVSRATEVSSSVTNSTGGNC